MLSFFKKSQSDSNNASEGVDFATVRKSFIEYVERESTILQLDDFSKNEYGGIHIGYDCGYKGDGSRPIFLSATLDFKNRGISDGIIASKLLISSGTEFVESHYRKMEQHKGIIEKLFSFENLKFEQVGGAYIINIAKFHVDLSQQEGWHAEFRWLRENLEKLYWVLRIHNTLQWDGSQ